MHLYELFKGFCSTGPKVRTGALDKRYGKSYTSIYFQTSCLPCFNELHELFSVDGKKQVPSNIGDLLTIEGLAYWIADDGGWIKSKGHVILSTNSFTLAEVELLVSVLNTKFDLKTHITKQICGYQIVIPSYSIPGSISSCNA